jgi:hypothetical protein
MQRDGCRLARLHQLCETKVRQLCVSVPRHQNIGGLDIRHRVPVVLADVVNRQDVGIVERRGRLRLALEPAASSMSGTSLARNFISTGLFNLVSIAR